MVTRPLASASPFNLKAAQDAITALLQAQPELGEDEILRADMIEGQTSAFEFMSMIVRKIGAIQANAAGLADYIGELQERKSRFEQHEEALRGLIMKVMNTAELKKAILPEATLSMRAGVQRVEIINERELPEEYFRIKKEPDKTRIKAVLNTGNYVPGAALSNAEPVLAILVR
jgi:rhamnogalacturonyl hydrolase YesR